MKIKLKDKYKKIKNIWMKNPKNFINAYNKSKKIQCLKSEKQKNIIAFYLIYNRNIYWNKKEKKVRNE